MPSSNASKPEKDVGNDIEKIQTHLSEVAIGETFHSSQVSWLEQFKRLLTSRRAVYAAVACSSSAVMIGYDMTLIGSIIANQTFVEKFGSYNESSKTWSLPASRQLVWSIVQYTSAAAGAFAVGALNDIFGRRICFFLTVGMTIVGTITELLSPNWKVWILAKVLFGTAMGFMQGNTPTYVSEIAPVHIRGFMLSLFQFWIIFGAFVAACVLEGTSKINSQWSWKAAIISQIGLGVLCLALFIPLVPESPYFLVSKSRSEAAKAALNELRGHEPDYSADQDVALIEESLAAERQQKADSGSYLECFQGTDLRRTLLAALPMMMQMFLGYPLCGNYLAYFLTLSGISNSFLINVISVMFSMLAVLFAFVLIEQVGRRPQYLCGVCGMLPCLLGIGILGFVNPGTKFNGTGLAALAILWSIFFYLSVGAVGWTLVGEISSSRLRAKTTSIAVIVNSLFNMGFSIGIPYLINADELNLGPKTGFVFLGPSIILALIAYFGLPETKNKTFAELDRLFEARTSARKF